MNIVPAMTAPLFVQERDRAREWIRVSRDLAGDVQFENAYAKRRIAAAYFRISIDHQVGVWLLSDDQAWASMRALLRPQYDALLRGIWFLEFATPIQASAFLKGPTAGVPPKITSLANTVATLERFQGDVFTNVHKQMIDLMHDYTHGGRNQVLSYLQDDEIDVRCKPEEAAWILRTSSTFGLLALNEMLALCGAETKALEVFAHFERIFGVTPLTPSGPH